MKKRNLFLLIIISILSLCILIGLLLYAFHLQTNQDSADNNTWQNEESSDQTSSGSTQESNIPTPTEVAEIITTSPTPTTSPAKSIVLGFAGDVNLDENNPPARKYDSEGKGILGLISEDLLSEMKAADIMMLNNEFSYSTRGTKAPDKSYTFRAAPSRAGILKDMGVDIVSLANNHALDYGPEALIDTFDTLDNVGIEYIGAGKNLDLAKAPAYFDVEGKKIAFVAASRVVFSMNWYATDTELGMVGTYDPTLILESIKEAKANSDYVVMFVHWGVERENYPVDYQRELAKQYIDAGADAVVGCHPHVMQGFEYYNGKPIAYSLGNYIFTSRTNKSGLLKLYLDPEGGVRMQLRPVMYENTYTYLLTKKTDKKEYFDYMKKLSYNVKIDNEGFISPE